MPFFLQIWVTCITMFSFMALFCASDLYAVMDPRFELDPQVISGLKSTQQVGAKRAPGTAAKTASAHAKESAKSVKRKSAPPRRNEGGNNSAKYASGNAPRQSFKLESPVPALTDQETIERTQAIWKMIVPPQREQQKPLSFESPTFSLSLDHERYPVFARMNGGRIILDHNGTIPPLVRFLIEDKDPSVRIVTESPGGSKKFISSLLEAAGFYSVEENFSMEFGADPKITVRADFKVEKKADSLINQDVVIINNNHTAFPTSIGNLLKKGGFVLYEPFATLGPLVPQATRTIHAVSVKKQPEMVDSILSAFSLLPEKNKHVDVFTASDNGISLSVKAERFFVQGGKRYVVTTFDGDPISYTLFRILETRGINVIILAVEDDFRKVTEKILSRMKIKGSFAQHNLLQDDSSGYALQMSGFKLDNASLSAGDLFLTDRNMSPVVRDLLRESGFTINNH